MKHHNFVIGKNDNPEEKIKHELDFLRNENKGFKLLQMKVIPNFTGSTLATVEYSHD